MDAALNLLSQLGLMVVITTIGAVAVAYNIFDRFTNR
jgi:hypothetical protein